MNKNDLIINMSKRVHLSKSKCEQFMNEFYSLIVDALKKGDEITIRNFGKFKVSETKQRKCINPQTKRYYICKPKKVISFKCFKNFKFAVK